MYMYKIGFITLLITNHVSIASAIIIGVALQE